MKILHFNHKPKSPEAEVNHHKLTHRIWRDPYTDWIIVLSVSFVLAAFLVFAGVRTYYDIEKRMAAAYASAGSASAASIDTRSLTMVLDRFAAREAERNDLYRGYRGPSDPSL